MRHTYLIAMGSNMRVPGIGGPRRVLAAACEALDARHITLTAIAPIIESAPIGPSLRRYANGAGLATTALAPPQMLASLQRIERDFGRGRAQRRGSRWRARALDLDIILWSGGMWADPRLSIPHPLFRERDFVLGPASAVAPRWRDPVSGLSIRQLSARHTKNTKKGAQPDYGGAPN